MISSREKKIINELIYHNDTFMLIKELAGKLGVSSRTVHRELKNVRSTLKKLNIELISEYKKGVKLDLAQLEIERSEEHTSELQSRGHLVCRLLLAKKKKEKT